MDMPRGEIKSNRRLYLCTYDVSSDKRRTRLFEMLKDHGEHVQYSVFLCELTPRELARVNGLATEIVHQNEDQLLILDIGPPGLDWTQHLICLGKPWTPQVRCHII
jgi:CRISPR-associated protein Cas2